MTGYIARFIGLKFDNKQQEPELSSRQVVKVERQPAAKMIDISNLTWTVDKIG